MIKNIPTYVRGFNNELNEYIKEVITDTAMNTGKPITKVFDDISNQLGIKTSTLSTHYYQTIRKQLPDKVLNQIKINAANYNSLHATQDKDKLIDPQDVVSKLHLNINKMMNNQVRLLEEKCERLEKDNKKYRNSAIRNKNDLQELTRQYEKLQYEMKRMQKRFSPESLNNLIDENEKLKDELNGKDELINKLEAQLHKDDEVEEKKSWFGRMFAL